MRSKGLAVLILFFIAVGTVQIRAGEGDTYYQCTLQEIKIIGGQLPDYEVKPSSDWRALSRRGLLIDYMQPYAKGNNGEEIYFFSRNKRWGYRVWESYRHNGFLSETFITVHSKGKAKPGGYLYIPKPDLSGMVRLVFQMPEPKPGTDRETLRKNFLEAKSNYYNHLLHMGVPGAAWFRHQAVHTWNTLKGKEAGKEFPQAAGGLAARRSARSEMERTFSLFSGGRALSENLQLDRKLRVPSPSDETIPIDTLQGITTTEMDWKKEVKGLKPSKDTLAAFVPSDQYAVFFPSFQAMLDLTDELNSRGTPVLQLLEPRSEDAMTRKRYQRQLCLSSSGLSRIFGPHVVKSVAFTGSDPYLRTGADLAVLFETANPRLLQTTIALKQNAAKTAVPGCQKVEGVLHGIPYTGMVSPDRVICSYMAVVAKRIVLVTNSMVQLERVILTAERKIPALAGLDEYIFFRDRYKLGEKDDAAFLMLSDAAIRKWCSPKWRIGDSRRTRAAAEMMETQAANLQHLAQGKRKPVSSPVYGNLAFLTPISELKIEKVSPEEARAYKWFRDHYQQQWRRYFDPIAVRFTLDKNSIGIDISVRPLILESSYYSIMDISGRSAITRDAGDPHANALIHFLLALDPQSPSMQRTSKFVSAMAPQVAGPGLNWIGNWMSVYMDKDPFWKELEAVKAADGSRGVDRFMEKNYNRLPVALVVAVSDSLKLSIFLAGLRAFIEQTGPGLTTWETFKHKGHSYVRIRAKQPGPGREKQPRFEIYYAPTLNSLVLSLSKKVIKGFLERRSGSRDARRTLETVSPWLGESMCFTARDPVLTVLRILYGGRMKSSFQRQAWSNIYILNEWKRRFAVNSPLQFHEQFWHLRLLCPGGGTYSWNEDFNTFESTVFGHPGQPKETDILSDPLYNIAEVNLGLTFEENGLRARGVLTRKTSKN
jgi:hypothetical protein